MRGNRRLALARLDRFTALGAGQRVLALVVLPLLPEGPYGPLGGVRPRELWALRDVRFSFTLGWWLTLFVSAFAVIGTRDNLAFHRATWELAAEANAAGIPNLKLDAGASWDGYYLGQEALETLGYNPRPGLLWWFSIYTPQIDPQYTIATKPTARYEHVVLEKRYDLWLDTRPARLLLLRRDDVSGPP